MHGSAPPLLPSARDRRAHSAHRACRTRRCGPASKGNERAGWARDAGTQAAVEMHRGGSMALEGLAVRTKSSPPRQSSMTMYTRRRSRSTCVMCNCTILGWCIFACAISSLATVPSTEAGITLIATRSPLSRCLAQRTTPWAPAPSSPASESSKLYLPSGVCVVGLGR